MSTFALLFALFAALSGQATAQQSASASPAPQTLQAGAVIYKVLCAAQPGQSYALYVPSYYNSKKRLPIVYAFDPAARGNKPVELMKDAAERYGYIVAGSNNSENGPMKDQFVAAQAVFEDTHLRLAIDNKRVYFAGFSGGARFAATLAQHCRCAAGVLLNGAGFLTSSPPTANGAFPIFATAGTIDLNYDEVVELGTKLEMLHYPHAFRRFDGPHEWAPASVMDEALAWFRLIAMKNGLEPRDMIFVKERSEEAVKRAESLAAAGDLYGSWEEYRQAADTFSGLDGISSTFRERATALEKDKSVLDGAKREKEEFEEQARLRANVSSGLAALGMDTPDRATVRNDVEAQILELRSRVQREKGPQELRVAQRALYGVYVEAIEDGEHRLAAKDISNAFTYFELAADARPDSAGPLMEMAVARAINGDRKGALEALRGAREKTKDIAEFSAWLARESAFDKFRDAHEFRALTAPPQDPH